jgi:hypothetical protein
MLRSVSCFPFRFPGCLVLLKCWYIICRRCLVLFRLTCIYCTRPLSMLGIHMSMKPILFMLGSLCLCLCSSCRAVSCHVPLPYFVSFRFVSHRHVEYLPRPVDVGTCCCAMFVDVVIPRCLHVHSASALRNRSAALPISYTHTHTHTQTHTSAQQLTQALLHARRHPRCRATTCRVPP